MMENVVTVTATFDRLDGSEPVVRNVELSIRNDYVYMRGGPTGYESAPTVVLTAGKDWYACFGTPGVWAQCIVSAAELARAAEVLL